MVMVEEWVETDAVKQALERSAAKPVLLLKHSTRCPVSAAAYEEFHQYAKEAAAGEVECAQVLVIEYREVSNAVSQALGIKHESPQVILIRNGRAVWHASHERIEAAALAKQISGRS